MEVTNILISALIGYLLGSISPSYFLARAKGFDIREKGTGNAGASNVTQTMGWGYGIFTALFDIFKSFGAVLLCTWLFRDKQFCGRVAGIMAVMGHMFPFYMGFKGGKGFASYTGMTLAFDWKFCLIMVVVSILITLVTDYIALATILFVIVCPVYYYLTGGNLPVLIMLCVLGLIIIYKHRINIQRILKGEEIGLRQMKKHRVI